MVTIRTTASLYYTTKWGEYGMNERHYHYKGNQKKVNDTDYMDNLNTVHTPYTSTNEQMIPRTRKQLEKQLKRCIFIRMEYLKCIFIIFHF